MRPGLTASIGALPFLLGLLPDRCGAGLQRVLFVGDSYIFVNNLPGTYKDLAERRLPGLHVEVASFVVGGQTLAHAAQAASCRAKVEAGNYDVLVLQEQSCVGGVPDSLGMPWRTAGSEAVATYFGPQAARLGKTVVLYETWGRRDGAPTRCGSSVFDKLFPTFAAMQSKVTAGYVAYEALLKRAGVTVLVARAGEARASVRLRYGGPGPEPATDASTLFHRLYLKDGSHPSVLGQYLTASSLFTTLHAAYARDCKASHALPGVPAEEAVALCTVAAQDVQQVVTPSALSGVWVSAFEALQPTVWSIQGTTATPMQGGAKVSQGFSLSQSGRIQDAETHAPKGLYVVQLIGDAAFWSDGDVWTRFANTTSQTLHHI